MDTTCLHFSFLENYNAKISTRVLYRSTRRVNISNYYLFFHGKRPARNLQTEHIDRVTNLLALVLSRATCFIWQFNQNTLNSQGSHILTAAFFFLQHLYVLGCFVRINKSICFPCRIVHVWWLTLPFYFCLYIFSMIIFEAAGNEMKNSSLDDIITLIIALHRK